MNQKTFSDRFNSLNKKQKIQIIVVLFLCFAVGLGITYFIQNASRGSIVPSTPPVLVEKKTGPVSLTLSSSSEAIQKDETVTVTLTLDSGGQEVDAADFVLTYDQRLLSAENLTDGTYFKSWPVKTADKGIIKLSGVATLEGTTLLIPKGTGTIAVISFQALETGVASVDFNRDKTIVASEGKNILDTSKLKELKIKVE